MNDYEIENEDTIEKKQIDDKYVKEKQEEVVVDDEYVKEKRDEIEARALKRVMEARESISDSRDEERKKNEARQERNKKKLAKKVQELKKGQKSVKDMMNWIESRGKKSSKEDDKG